MQLKKGRYQHYKGNYYEVIDSVRHSETEEVLVLYRQLYGDRALWVRPYNHFCEMVTVNDTKVSRFRFVDDSGETT
ncbi:DUF1653 domain-containing protein [Glaciecola sp. 1036]|uniref:DUF1653 domain-containing protein n=1 Tax=Alteromonadaceae TaxID=72275 RepID=UPI003CFF3B9E